MELKSLICINCPLGCQLEIENRDNEIIVKGNKCPKGKEYGEEEMRAPKRVITAVVKTNSLLHPYLPVKSRKPVKKEKIHGILKQLYSLEVSLPIKTGTVILSGIDNEGNVIVATRTLN